MCGLFGVVFRYGHKHTLAELAMATNVFESMAIFSASRGTDSTGIAVITKDGGYETYKGVLSSYEMVADKDWRDTIKEVDKNTHMLMGHTRYATTGEISLGNVHPFVVTNNKTNGLLIGAHNGVVSNHKQFGTHKCDSHNIMQKLSEIEVTRWVEVLDQLEGSFALTIWKNGTVALARNSDSPLMVMDVPELGAATIYASEEHTIRSALAIAGIASTATKVRSMPIDYLITQEKDSKPYYAKLRDSTLAGWQSYQNTKGDDASRKTKVTPSLEKTKPLPSLLLDSENDLYMVCVMCNASVPSRYLTVVDGDYICEECSMIPSQKMKTRRPIVC